MKCIVSLLFFTLFLLPLLVSGSNITECVNIPTAEVADYGIGELKVRVYTGGGIITRFVFSPFARICFGGSLDVEKFIGYETPEVHEPAFYFKWKVFDGAKIFPAVAVGYDGQGYNFVNKSYLFPPKGIFLTFSQNVLLEKLFVDLGVNLSKYKEETKMFGFLSTRFTLEELVNLAVEWENIGGENDIQRVNLELGLILAKVVKVDLLLINLNKGTENIERQVRINYNYKFL
ncbi:MAG: hypothetical protein N2555_00565 [Endomicrobia bacterium]|nr:hypothetical protein [Endomicrobiia bacterium]